MKITETQYNKYKQRFISFIVIIFLFAGGFIVNDKFFNKPDISISENTITNKPTETKKAPEKKPEVKTKEPSASKNSTSSAANSNGSNTSTSNASEKKPVEVKKPTVKPKPKPKPTPPAPNTPKTYFLGTYSTKDKARSVGVGRCSSVGSSSCKVNISSSYNATTGKGSHRVSVTY